MFDADGHLIACEGSDGGGRCVARWDVKTGQREVLADKYKGKYPATSAQHDTALARFHRCMKPRKYCSTCFMELNAAGQCATHGPITAVTPLPR